MEFPEASFCSQDLPTFLFEIVFCENSFVENIRWLLLMSHSKCDLHTRGGLRTLNAVEASLRNGNFKCPLIGIKKVEFYT